MRAQWTDEVGMLDQRVVLCGLWCSRDILISPQ